VYHVQGRQLITVAEAGDERRLEDLALVVAVLLADVLAGDQVLEVVLEGAVHERVLLLALGERQAQVGQELVQLLLALVGPHLEQAG